LIALNQQHSILHFSEGRSTAAANKLFFQPKSFENESNDVYEKEADAMAEKVMHSDASLSAPSFFSPSVIQCKGEINQTSSSQTENYISSISGGKPLNNNEKAFFESRMGYDFSNVRIHNDSNANQSAKSISALAYTHGNNIVFGSNQYQPNTAEGRKLMAHELTHVVQQSNNNTANNIQRYSDTDHHILEEVALTDIFSEEELKSIEHGNMGRDYSQLPSIGSALLVGEPNLGGYKGYEHFDNFIFDREKNRWVSHSEYEKIWDDNVKEWVNKPVSLKSNAAPKITPLQYIESELQKAVEKDMPDSGSFMHVGNAFHTIEDFFAHSNFVELTKGDFSFGKELTTHASGVPGAESTDSILSNVLDPVPASVYKEKFQKGYEEGSTLSHGRLAKDFHINPNHSFAITLSALVIRQTAIMVKNTFSLKTKEQRNEYIKDPVIKTLSDYFRPPDEKNKWWEKLMNEDNGRTAKKIKELQDKTPVTVNQTPGSPLRNLEATRFSSWKAIGLGTSIAVPLKDNTFFTAGYMLYAPGTGVLQDDKLLVAPRSEWDQADKPKIIFGAQISGTFDLNDLFNRRR
jgi:hypothetical protein